MPDIYIFSAYSGTGKTTYLERLIPCLKERGLRVAVVKHDVHGLALDREGKDSRRFARVGADAVAVVSGGECLLAEPRPLELSDVLGYLPPADIVLVEGFRQAPYPKIALYRKEAGQPLSAEAAECAAVVTDTPLEMDCPQFPLDAPELLAAHLAGAVQRGAARG